MKWKTIGADQPNLGDERVRVKFAWTPVNCSDGYTRWLEWVCLFERHEWRDKFPGGLPYWYLTSATMAVAERIQ